VNVDRGNWKDPGASAPSGAPARSWNPQQEIGGRGAVSAAKNTFSQPAQRKNPFFWLLFDLMLFSWSHIISETFFALSRAEILIKLHNNN